MATWVELYVDLFLSGATNRYRSLILKIGAHVSTAGGVDKAIDRASLIEAEAVQIFVSSPRGWTFKPLDAATITLFREKSVKSSINPVVFH